MQNDPWIEDHGILDPEVLHAIGLVAVYFNQAELHWEELVWRGLGLTEDKGQKVTRGLSLTVLSGLAVELFQEDNDNDFVNLLKNARGFAGNCNSNRSKIVHARISFGGNILTPRQRKKAQETKVILNELSSVRRIADDLRSLNATLFQLLMYHSSRTTDIYRPKPNLPDELGGAFQLETREPRKPKQS